ncbi:MAG: MerR family transcriptional regulator, partial [bacterium]
MSEKPKNPQKLKIGQLASLSGATVSTIKFYLKEGLIDPPVKGKGSMSYYSQSHVDRIITIKKLQKERFFPLNVIKKMLSTKPAPENILTITEGLEDNSWDAALSTDLLPLAAIIEQTGFTVEMLDRIEREGFIHSVTTLQGRMIDALDLEILLLFKSRKEAGLPLDHTLQIFSIYKKHLRQAVNEDVLLCLQNVLTRKEGADFINYITEGERTATAFTSLCKIKFTRMQVNDIIKKHETIPIRIVEALNFRSLEGMAPMVRSTYPELEFTSLLELILDGAPPIGNRTSTAGGKPSPNRKPVQLLIHSMLDMTEGNNRQALTTLKRINSKSEYAPLASSLKGLVQITQISRISSMVFFMEEMRNAVAFFEKSKQPSLNAMVDLLASYCRLVGAAVRPNFFDLEKDAGTTFDHIVSQCETLSAALPNGRLIQPFFQELILKSSYFMVLMYQEREWVAKAATILDRMLTGERDNFYSVWAQRKKLEIAGQR